MSSSAEVQEPVAAADDPVVKLICDSYIDLKLSDCIPSTSALLVSEASSETGTTDSNDSEQEIEVTYYQSRKESIEDRWAKYWEEKGDEIVNKSWLEKYKDYINPEFDLSSWSASGVTEYLETSKESPEETESAQATPVAEQAPAGAAAATTGNLSEADVNSLWAYEWEQHYSNTYYREYNKYVDDTKAADEAKLIMPNDILRNKALKKYWVMRYHLFSKYDDGIKLDEESWFSVTPENIAKHIASRCRRVDGVIVDAFCGCGGNTIQFATKFSKVIAIDIDPVKIKYAKQNAAIYGVEKNIDFIVGDYLQLAPTLKADVVFLSPPWGGPNYANVPIFSLKKMQPLDGYTVFNVTREITQNIAFYVPRNTDKAQLMELAGEQNFVEIERNMFKKKVKAVTAYYGDLIKPSALSKVQP